MKVVSVASMRALDERTIAAGTPGHVLMERAGRQVFLELQAFMANRLGPTMRGASPFWLARATMAATPTSWHGCWQRPPASR